MRPVWTYAKIERLTELWAAGTPAAQIARELAVSDHTVTRKARELGLYRKPYQRRPIPSRVHPLVRQLIAECIERGVSRRALSDRSGVSLAGINDWTRPSKRKMPSLLNIEAAFNALGFDLVAKPRNQPASTPQIVVDNPSRSPRLSDILDHTSRISTVPVTDIRKRCKRQDMAFARHMFCWLARQYTSASLQQIARFIGLRDHTSALHGHRRIAAMIASGEIERPAPPPAPASVAPMRPVALALEAAE